MRIYSLSKILAFPIIIVFAYMMYLQFGEDKDMGYYLMIPLSILIFLYVSHGNIDYWYLQKYPIKLDTEILDWLDKYCTFYKGLSTMDQERFRYRLSMYMEGRSFKSVGSEHQDLPEDLKAIVACNAIQVSFHSKDFLIGDYDYIYVYKHPFQTPKNQYLHTVETEAEDGVLIFSMEHLIPGMINSDNFYNIGLHGYSEAFIESRKSDPFPRIDNVTWDDIETISNLTPSQIKATLGSENPNMSAVVATCYLVYHENFQKHLPGLATGLNAYFGQ